MDTDLPTSLTQIVNVPQVALGPRKRVLLIAYAISPVLGSEYRSAWELAHHIGRVHDVTVLYGDSDGLMGSFAHFDAYTAEKDVPFRAIKIEPTSKQVAIAKRMRRMPWGLFFPVLLRRWHKKAFEVAKQLHAAEPFDIAHQLGPIGFRNPGYLWQLDCHTYWGPIGGAQYIDTRMIRDKRTMYFGEALFRNLSVRLQARAGYIARAARGFDRVSFATVENAAYFETHFGRKGPVISDQGLYDKPDPETVETTAKAVAPGGRISVAWAGSLTPRKNVDALLDIIRAAPQDIDFHVMGGGPREAEIKALAQERPNLKFRGMLNRTEVMETLNQCDAILLTSLSEANTAILFEGIEHDCIPIAPRINGFVSTLNDEVAFLINQGDYKAAIDATVAALTGLQCPNTLTRMREALRAHRHTLSWNALAKAHTALYE